ncbi:DUF4012 domain-containing protein [Microbacterium proteolyticum]|uniref:DUF4012 domain-containing protein n=1 Tax=Microbacterium proteolyticum TaxID=1572644 RepID=UPI001FACD25B|nr:DUF4012 domain-containing protein [Microbacterium proteolyticum]MCI9858197.1 DUF4012 domain-containing protein [Microbacterium proteolyticum]
MSDGAQRAGRIAVWVVGTLLVVGVAIAGWVGVRGALAYQHLSAIRAMAPAAAATIVADPAQATVALDQLAAEAKAAHDLTGDPVWSLAELTPWVGPQLAAFGTIASSSDRLFGDSMLPLATAAQNVALDGLRPHDGRLDTTALSTLTLPAASASIAAADAAADIDRIDPTPLVGVVASAVDQARETFASAASGVDALRRATELLPSMLGEDGPRTYLLLVQNNAEWRSLGGVSGTAIELKAVNGTISLVGTESATSLSRGITAPVTELPADIQKIYGTRPARYFHNLTQIPSFPVDGRLAREMYRQQTGREVDGVMAVDPVVLSYILEATGPVTLPSGDSLTPQNAVPLLLKDVYQRYSDPAAQDAFFADASGSVFEVLLNGQGSTPGLITALARGVDERRVLIWAASPAEQSVIEGTALAGELPQSDEQTARFGVYLNDGTGSKMSFYVKPTVALTWGRCGAVDRQLTMTMSLTNTAPADAAKTLPAYVTGNGAFGTPPGAATVVSNVYLPQGWKLVSSTTTSVTGIAQATFEGRQVLTFGSTLGPQATDTVSVTVESSTDPSVAEALVTPTADASLPPTVRATCTPSSSATLG